jgi:hypothetical protein
VNSFWSQLVGLVAIVGPMILVVGVFGWDAQRRRAKPPH